MLQPDAGGFFGRDADCALLEARLSQDGVLVTVVGPPGVGKTRLAREVEKRCTAADSVFCDLSEATTAEMMIERLADSLGVRGASRSRDRSTGPMPSINSAAEPSLVRSKMGEPKTITDAVTLRERVADALAERGEMLLIVDNVEQLIEHIADVVPALRQAAPTVRWLVTSREKLGLLGEWCHEVAPLVADGSADADAVNMLADRITRARGTAPADYERQQLARIALRLDGLPLALELAASRIAMLGAAAVEVRLEKQLEFLTHGPRDLDPRQRTLRNAIAWSWDLLAPNEQRVLTQLAVFRGGFDLDAALSVVSDDEEGAMDVVQRLRQKSLLYTVAQSSGQMRFGLYLSIREFASKELKAQERADAQERHARFFALGMCTTRDVANIMANHDNITAAIDRCVAMQTPASLQLAARLLLGLSALIDRAPLEPYSERLDAFLSLSSVAEYLSSDLRIAVQTAAGRCMRRLGRLKEAKKIYADALAFAYATAAQRRQAWLHSELGMLAFFESNVPEALTQWQTSISMWRELGNAQALALDQTRCGMILRESNRLDEAQTIVTEALAMHRALGDQDNVALTLAELAHIQLERGEVQAAQRLLSEANANTPANPTLLSRAAVLARAAFLAWSQGDLEGGTALGQRTLVLFAQIGYRRLEAGMAVHLAIANISAGLLEAADSQLRWARKAFGNDGRGQHWAGGWQGFLRWRSLDIDGARQTFASLPELPGDDPIAVTTAILRLPLQLDVADIADAAHALAAARLQPHGSAASQCSYDVRSAVTAVAEKKRRAASQHDPHSLAVRADGSEFAIDGKSYSLARYRTLRRLLLVLVDSHLAARGKAMPWESLFAAGWAGERVVGDAARNRVKVAVNSLRNAGLRDWLIHDGNGYLIDPTLQVHVATR
jgi:predicted ATPase/tetratricopeptide (TPR) repeat protein